MKYSRPPLHGPPSGHMPYWKRPTIARPGSSMYAGLRAVFALPILVGLHLAACKNKGQSTSPHGSAPNEAWRQSTCCKAESSCSPGPPNSARRLACMRVGKGRDLQGLHKTALERCVSKRARLRSSTHLRIPSWLRDPESTLSKHQSIAQSPAQEEERLSAGRWPEPKARPTDPFGEALAKRRCC